MILKSPKFLHLQNKKKKSLSPYGFLHTEQFLPTKFLHVFSDKGDAQSDQVARVHPVQNIRSMQRHKPRNPRRLQRSSFKFQAPPRHSLLQSVVSRRVAVCSVAYKF